MRRSVGFESIESSACLAFAGVQLLRFSTSTVGLEKKLQQSIHQFIQGKDCESQWSQRGQGHDSQLYYRPGGERDPPHLLNGLIAVAQSASDWMSPLPMNGSSAGAPPRSHLLSNSRT